MSDKFESLYEREKEKGVAKSSPVKRIVRMEGDYVDNFGGGLTETVDLSKIGVEGECCPHIMDVHGAVLIKECKLQTTVYYGIKGVERDNVQCPPRAYLNHWKKCPYRKLFGGKGK